MRSWPLLLLSLATCDALDEIAQQAIQDAAKDAAAPTAPAPSPGAPTPGTPSPREPRAATGPLAGGAIEIFFTTPQLVYPDIPDKRSPQPFVERLIADIDAATTSVDAATFEYNLTSVGEALVRAKKRGVKVRLALDEEHLEEKEEMAAWAKSIQAAKIPVSWEETSNFLHSKFFVIDGAIAWTGSWNLTNNDTFRNNNNILRITAPGLVANYQAEFTQMFSGTFGPHKETVATTPTATLGATQVENYFSPSDGVLAKLLPHLKGAKKSIYFMTFSFTEDSIAQVMIDKKNAGLSVKGVFEKRNANSSGSELPTLRSAGLDVREDGNCYTMHHKVIIIDERTVITGSYNFTARAEEKNDENVVILNDPAVASLYLDEFTRVYDQASQSLPCSF